MTKVRLFVLLAVVALVLFPAMAVAQPPLPCRVHGTVLLDGEDVAGNTTITATIGNDTYTTQTPSVYGASTYLLEIAPEEGTQYTAGETITFMIGARAADQTSAWETGGNIELNLTVGGPGPVSGEIDVIVSWSEGDSTLIGDVLTLYLGAQPQGPAGATGATGLAGADGEDATGGTALPIVALVIAIIAAGVAMMSMRRRV
jgi:hypothetical protein